MMAGRPPKARPKPLAPHDHIRDMYGFMVRPQHLERYREYATIYKEEEAERSDRWEQFLVSVNKSVSSAAARDLALVEANGVQKKRSESDDSIQRVGSGTFNRDSNGGEQGAKLWGQLRESLRAIEQTTSISQRGLHPSSLPTKVSATSNGDAQIGNSLPVLRGQVHRSSSVLADGDILTDGIVDNGARLADTETNLQRESGGVEGEDSEDKYVDRSGNPPEIADEDVDGARAVDTESNLVKAGGSDTAEDSEDEYCDATESAVVLLETESTYPSDTATPESPWEEELKNLVRGGVPMALRGELWQVFVGTKSRRIQGHYNALLTLLADGGGDGNGVGGLLDNSGSAAANYLVCKSGVIEKWTNQIEKDLPRTFPGHPALDEDGRNTLRRLLTAYARHNPSVGYCQAMNFLAALLLLLMPEENAFWTLTGIIDEYFEGYYAEKMVEAQVDQLVFEDLVEEQFPKLVNHLQSLGVQVAWVSGPWFLSIFVNVLPWETVLRVWDVLLYEGNRCMLFRTGLALMEIHAPALSATRDAGDAVATLQSMASDTFDSSQLVLMASMGFQTVTESRLQELRLKHRPQVLAALHERSIELHLWRNSNSAMTQKLPYLYNTSNSGEDSLLIKKSLMVSDEKIDKESAGATKGPQPDGAVHDHQIATNVKSPVSFEEISVEKAIIDTISPRQAEQDRDGDAREQVIWLKNELCKALEDKKAAIARSEELETALVEMAKQDNRRLLSAKVEKLEAEVNALSRQLTEKNEQELALVQVLVRMEQEQKIADDARRFAELDSTAQRRAVDVFQEKYESAADALAEMEKRAVMAETMLEATLSYQALGTTSPHGSGPLRRALTDSPLTRTQESTNVSPLQRGTPPSHQNGNGLNLQDSDENANKQGVFNRSFGLNWRDRSKARSNSFGAQTSVSSPEGSPATVPRHSRASSESSPSALQTSRSDNV